VTRRGGVARGAFVGVSVNPGLSPKRKFEKKKNNGSGKYFYLLTLLAIERPDYCCTWENHLTGHLGVPLAGGTTRVYFSHFPKCKPFDRNPQSAMSSLFLHGEALRSVRLGLGGWFPRGPPTTILGTETVVLCQWAQRAGQLTHDALKERKTPHYSH
jgi:hypothetical protein